jgi:addiction module HigA family antidote
MNSNRLLMVHPGRILLEEFLAPKGISVWRLAKDIDIAARRVYEIVQGQRPITTDIAHRLAITSVCRNGTGSICRHVMTGRESSYR